jgi:hypothetical protein
MHLELVLVQVAGEPDVAFTHQDRYSSGAEARPEPAALSPTFPPAVAGPGREPREARSAGSPVTWSTTGQPPEPW